jgi:hypothetical protein
MQEYKQKCMNLMKTLCFVTSALVFKVVKCDISYHQGNKDFGAQATMISPSHCISD